MEEAKDTNSSSISKTPDKRVKEECDGIATTTGPNDSKNRQGNFDDHISDSNNSKGNLSVNSGTIQGDAQEELRLINAAEAFDVKKTEELLESHGHYINETDEEGNNAVHRMLTAYISLDLVGQMHCKPKYLEILGILLQKGFNINAINNYGDTALHMICCYHGYEDIIKPLLASGAKVNAKNAKGLTALHLTVIKRLSSNAQTLVEGGADPNLGDSIGRTPLHLLVQGKRNLITLQHLLKCGADPMALDNGGRTPLHIASKWGRVNFMRELLICGAKASVTDHFGQTPLHYAVKGDLTGAGAQLLLEYKAHPDVQDRVTGETAMHKAIKLHMVDNIEELMKFRPNLNLPDVSGDTSLHAAARCTDLRVWDLLLRGGGDINLQNWQGYTPWQKATKAKNHMALSSMRVYDSNNSVGY